MAFFRKYGAGLCLLALGILFTALGAVRGEMDIVYRKAVQICMECIGLG